MLLNLFIVTLPVFLYQLFWVNSNKPVHVKERRSKIWIGLCSAISILFCISLPIEILPGYYFDLRTIPLFLSFMYADRNVGLLITLLMLAYRYSYFGSSGSAAVFAVYVVMALWLWIAVPRIGMQSSRRKSRFALIFSFIMTILTTSAILIDSRPSRLSIDPPAVLFFLVFIALHTLATWLIIVLIEQGNDRIRRREQQLKAEKLHILSELAATVAHEIRNPMTTARGFIQLLREQIASGDRKKKMYCDMVIQELDRALAIVSDYMALAKPQAEKREPLNLEEQTNRVIEMLSPFTLIRNVEIEKMFPPETLWVYGNGDKLQQCLINLMRNGIEAMPDGGGLRVTISRLEDRAVIDIIDQGIGMTDSEIKRLGEPFYSTKEKGTGLGMLLCFRIIDSLAGRLDIRSQKGRGTHCRITLPLLDKK